MSQRQRKLKKKQELVEKVIPKNVDNPTELGVKAIFNKYWWFVVLMCFLAIAVAFNGLGGNFVSDDYASITQNQVVGNFKDQWVGGNTATMVTYIVNQLFGFSSATPYHIANLVFYVPFLIVAFVVLMMLYQDFLVVGITMLVFAVHPIHVEAVNWISGRIYIIIGLYLMLAFLYFIYFIRKNNWRYLLGTFGFFMLAFLTDKPRPFSLFLIIILYILYQGIGKVKVNFAKLFGISSLIVVVSIIVAIPFIKNRIDIVNSGYNTSDSIFYNPFFQYPTGLSKYFQILVVPTDLTLYHTMYTFPVWLNWMIFLLYFANVIYFYFKDKRVFFALSFIVAGVLPSITPIKVSWLVAERYIFLGSLGYCLLLGIIFGEIWKKNKVVSAMLVGALIMVFSIRSIMRNDDWTTNHKLWVNTCQVSPNSHNAWNNIGDDYDKLNDPANAIKGFTQSTIVKPNYADAYHNRANIFFKIKRLDLARESYMTALNFSPGLYQTYLSLTQIDLMEGKNDLAIQHSEAALKLQPENPQAAYVVGVVYAQVGRIPEAKKIFQAIVQRYPGYALAAEALKNIDNSVK